ncbi:MAG: hypothetical protein IPG81_09690 [Sandaracinaceae bacterium]|nr:hypothetical protein [Sandaracinaceae bacterium]
MRRSPRLHRPRPRVPMLMAGALTLCLIVLVTGGSRAQVADTRVDLGEITATAARQPVSSPWLRVRIREVVGQLDAECYQPALARRAGVSGELQVRANLARSGRLTGVAVTRARGGTLPAALATCVRAAFARAQLDLAPLPATPVDTTELGAYVEQPRRGPPEVRYPVRLSFRLALSAPPAPLADTPAPHPDPTPAACGRNPEGCRSSGCPSGMRCDTRVACVPSSCGCNAETGQYVCTSDCGGGMCVRDRPSPPAQP